MKKTKTLNNTLYQRLFETLNTFPEDDICDEDMIEIMQDVLTEELDGFEPVCGFEDGEYKITRLGVLNTVISAFLPGYRLVLEVEEDSGTIGDVYLAEV